jgi:hypothetical protein
MSRPLRYMPMENTVLEVTTRTIQGRLLLRPTAELNQIILGILGRALALYPITLYLVVVASNHVHFILSACNCQLLAKFMCYFNSNLAREAGRLYHWREKIWGRRYRSIPILDDATLVQRVRYLLSHGCKEGLVLRPGDWPGVNCVEALVQGKKLSGVWYDRTREYEARRAGRDSQPGEFASRYEVSLTPLPMLEDKSREEQMEWYRQLVEDIERKTRERLGREGRRVMGAKVVLGQRPHGRPAEVKRSPAPLCHCDSMERWIAFRDQYRWFVSLYREASRRLRSGDLKVRFPANCFRPALAFNGPSYAPG